MKCRVGVVVLPFTRVFKHGDWVEGKQAGREKENETNEKDKRMSAQGHLAP